jgi:hypothetical protein
LTLAIRVKAIRHRVTIKWIIDFTRLYSSPMSRNPICQEEPPREVAHFGTIGCPLRIRMYNPHEAREDTVLFPAFRRIVPSHEYEALGETFEEREHALFGEDGFEKMADRVATIEKRLGLYNLAQFTPRH